MSTGLFEKVFVSTDSEAISATARDAGAEVPFLRTSALSDDFTGTLPVVLDAVNRLGLDDSSDLFVLYSTSLLSAKTLLDFADQVALAPNEFHVGVRKFPHPLERALVGSLGKSLVMKQPEFSGTRTQDLETFYFDCGKVYASKVSSWKSRASMLDGPIRGFEIPLKESFDADTLEEIDFLTSLQRL